MVEPSPTLPAVVRDLEQQAAVSPREGEDSPSRRQQVLIEARRRDETRIRSLMGLAREMIDEVLAEAEAEPVLASRRIFQAETTLSTLRHLAGAYAQQNPSSRRRGKRGYGGSEYGFSVDGAVMASDDGGEEDFGPESPQGTVSNANLLTGQLAETFGAKTIEEIVAALPRIISRYRTKEQVSAIVTAREGGLLDVADALEDRLRSDMGLPARPAGPNLRKDSAPREVE